MSDFEKISDTSKKTWMKQTGVGNNYYMIELISHDIESGRYTKTRLKIRYIESLPSWGHNEKETEENMVFYGLIDLKENDGKPLVVERYALNIIKAYENGVKRGVEFMRNIKGNKDG